jgi:hypothetical protein
MNEDWFDFNDSLIESSLLDIEDDSIFIEWTSMEGSERINELSRQLRTFLNYKFALIRQRYSKSSDNNKKTNAEKYKKHSLDFSRSVSEYLFLIKIIGADEDCLAEKIKCIMEKAKFNTRDFKIEILKKLKFLGANIWNEIHILSEFDQYNSTLLKIVFRTAKLLCNAEIAFYFPYRDFYRELDKNYVDLEYEISNLLQSNRAKQCDDNHRQLRVKILE